MVFLFWCGGVFVLVWWCSCGCGVGGVFVVVFLRWWFDGVFVVVFLGWCGEVFVAVFL